MVQLSEEPEAIVRTRVLWVLAVAALILTVAGRVGASVEERAVDRPLSRLEFKGATWSEATRLISEMSGANIVTSPEAGKRELTAYLRDVSALEAVDTLCRANGLWYRLDESTGVIRVMTTEEFQRDLVVARDDITRTFTLRNPNAVSVAAAVRDLYGQRVLLSFGLESDDPLFEQDISGAGGAGGTASIGEGSFDNQGRPRGATQNSFGNTGSFTRTQSRREDVLEGTDLTPDQLALLSESPEDSGQIAAEFASRELPIYVSVVRQHNVVLVRTSDQKAIDDIGKLVEQLDRPTAQVFLVMKILEIALDDGFESAFDIELLGGGQTGGTGSTQPVNPLNPGTALGPESAFGSGNFPLSANTLVYQYLSNDLRLRLQLLKTDGKVRTLSSPVLLASNNLPSRLFVGEERVLTTGVNTAVVTPATGATTTAIEPITEVRDIGNTLLIRPKINADRSVTLVINHDSSSVSPASATIPVSNGSGGVTEFSIDTVNAATLQTTIVAKDGLTVAIGGLIRSSYADSISSVPILGSIPLIGFFFREEVRELRRTELVLLVTPHVIGDASQAHLGSGRPMTGLSGMTLDDFPELEPSSRVEAPKIQPLQRQ